MAGDADAARTLAHLPKDETGRPGRAPENLQADVSEATASAVKDVTTPNTVSEAGQRDAYDVRARHTNVTEEATR